METLVAENNNTQFHLPETMQAAQFLGHGKIEVKACDVPEISDNEVLIAMEGCGLCASNLPVFDGREWFEYPFACGNPGHEGWGRVVAMGEKVNNVELGDRVAVITYHAFAEYDKAPASDVVKIPESLAEKPFPGEPLACAVNIFERSQIEEGQTVAVIGVGFLGALLISLLKEKGAEVIAITRRQSALDLAEELGADQCIKLEEHWPIVDQVKKITSQELCSRVIEATGKQWPLDLAGDIVGEGGKIIVAGFHQDGLRQVNMQTWNWKGIDVINAHERDPRKYITGMQKAVKMVENGQLNPFPLFTHTFYLSEIQQAFDLAVKRPEGYMKALILMK